MEFGLSEEQRLFDEAVRGFLADRVPMEERRRLAEGEGFDAGLWDGLVELGLTGMLVPERFGGSGLGVFDAALAAEALGAAAAPVPFAGPAVMAPLAILAAGDAGQQARWLPRIASGEVRVAVAFAGLSGTAGAGTVRIADASIDGELRGVMDAAGATHLIVMAGDGGMALVAADAAGVAVEVRRSLDRTRALGHVTLTGAAGEPLAAANDPLAAARRVLDAGRIMLAADTLGACQHMVDEAVAYALQRVQFGRVIASFQGVKHTCADMVTMLEPARSLVWYAAYAQDAVPDEARMAACHAKAHLGEVGRDVSRHATEVHGGMGFTDLLGLHYWFKRVAFDRQLLGSPERCREEAAAAQGWIAA